MQESYDQNEYDVFISYKTEQRSWADRIFETLTARGLSVFVDHKEIKNFTYGSEDERHQWDAQISHAIQAAKNYILLWSKEITERPAAWREGVNVPSTYVRNEIKEILELCGVGRPLILFNLDHSEMNGENVSVMDGKKTVEGIKKAHAKILADIYEAAGGADEAKNVPLNKWFGEIINPIFKIIKPELVVKITPLSVLILAMTQTDAQNLKANPEGLAEDQDLFKQFLNRGATTWSVDHYGATSFDWKPFPSDTNNQTILEIANEIEYTRQIAKLERRKRNIEEFDYHDVNEILMNRTRKLVRDQQNCILIVDPVTLMHRHYLTKFNRALLWKPTIILPAPLRLYQTGDLATFRSGLIEYYDSYLGEAWDLYKERHIDFHDDIFSFFDVEHIESFNKLLEISVDRVYARATDRPNSSKSIINSSEDPPSYPTSWR